MDVSDQRVKTKEEAAAWVLRLESGDVPRAERDAFVEWLRESPLHVAEMLRLTNVHDALAGFDGWAEADLQGADAEPIVVSLSGGATAERPDGFFPHAHSRSRLRTLGAAMACVVVLGVGGIALRARLGDNVISTERGERRAVALSDGSMVQIDPDTELRVHFDKSSREILLNRGRALFRVAKNPARPFSVRAEKTVVRAIGTLFGVERSQTGVRVTVSEGKVAVTNLAPSPLQPTVSPPASLAVTQEAARPQRQPAEVFLTANQQITMKETGSAEVVHTVDSERELAWARGQLVFEKETVAAVVKDFNRYNQMQLHVVDAALAGQLVSGVFDASDPESFIAFLRSTANIRVSRSDGAAVELASAH
jgi:transmembrane sensor